MAFALATAAQHGPPGQQMPSGQHEPPAAGLAVAQQSPSGQQAPSGQQEPSAVLATCSVARSLAGVEGAPLQAMVDNKATAATTAPAKSFAIMVSFSKRRVFVWLYTMSAGRPNRLAHALGRIHARANRARRSGEREVVWT